MSVADIFDAIADGNRRFVLEELKKSPRTVNELASMLPISRPAVSQHLKVLLDADLVEVESQGTKRVYSVKELGLMRLNIWIDQFWSED